MRRVGKMNENELEKFSEKFVRIGKNGKGL